MELTPEVLNIDCMEAMKKLPDYSFDLIVTDPPYGITNNKWDVDIDLDLLWIEWKRLIKPNGALIFTTAQPFTTDMINSNREMFRYDLVWEKSIITGFLNANRMPLRAHETILVFYKNLPTYNPQKYKLNIRPSYKKANKNNKKSSPNYGAYTDDMDKGSKDGTRFPRSVFHVDYENSFFDSSFDSVQKMIHPTQKPVALFKYLISTYSNKGDSVMDCFMGSGASRIAANDLNRKFWGYEIDKDYFEAHEKRFNQHISQLTLSL